jgi:hypothetical protein
VALASLEVLAPFIDKTFKDIRSCISNMERDTIRWDCIIKEIFDYVTQTITAEKKSLLYLSY